MISPDERRARERRLNAEKNRRYRDAHREEACARTQAWRAANPEKVKAWTRSPKAKESRDKYLYGLSVEKRAQLLAEQNSCCYLCGEPLDLEKPQKVHVDHDHSCCRGARSCGKCVRGLACEPCNKAIGLFGDNPERMKRAAERLAVANAKVAAAKRAAPVQEELPLNVARLPRRKESA